MNKHANIRTYTLLGVMANFCFVLFILLGFLYYAVWTSFGTRSDVADIGIYPFEIIGFVLLGAYTAAYVASLYEHKAFKTLSIAYFFAELFLILLDFRFIFPNMEYNNGSLPLITANLVLSIPVCLSYRSLAPVNLRFTRAVMITLAIIAICFAILSLVFSVKIYFTVLANNIGYLFLNTYMYIQMNKGNLEIEARELFPDR